MKVNLIKALFIGSGLCLLSGLVLAALAFKGSLGSTNGENDVSLGLQVEEMWQLYLMLGLVVVGVIGLLVASVAWVKYDD